MVSFLLFYHYHIPFYRYYLSLLPMFRFSAINLGCSKNLVDLEYAIGEILKFSNQTHIEYYDNPEDPEVEYVIVNTCWFLSSARQESEETLTYYDSLGKKLILMGCYVSVKDDAFLSNLKNLSSIVPFMSYSVIEELLFGKKSKLNLSAIVRAKQAHKESKEKTLTRYLESIAAPGKNEKAFVWKGDEVRAHIHAPFGYEYLKIAEGCDNNCTFCIIPTIRGRQQSRPIEDIIKEVKVMLGQGIQEIQIISQDTTRYGTDLSGKPQLIELLEKIDETISVFIQQANIPTSQHPKYRVYYLYPDIMTLEHLEKLTQLKHFLPYFDIPFQHISEHILKKMGRHYNQKHIFSFLDTIRSSFPESFIRTACIIGFPGETDTDFQELCDFVIKYEFESVGVFQYHDEPLAASSSLPEKVADEIAKNRVHILWAILEKIYTKKRNSRTNKNQTGFIMRIGKKTCTIRPELHAPEVDEYDEINLSSILDGNIQIGSKVLYNQLEVLEE